MASICCRCQSTVAWRVPKMDVSTRSEMCSTWCRYQSTAVCCVLELFWTVMEVWNPREPVRTACRTRSAAPRPARTRHASQTCAIRSSSGALEDSGGEGSRPLQILEWHGFGARVQSDTLLGLDKINYLRFGWW